ncbi:uncharacterized protein LOC106778988 [Vigna radiata var. radiata]|uniref:Uncharacterized protein LOC106778988 n=1 Tax=Vigna radiata var. radiata TaxID=3916 RepID=A0A1S3VVT6_VIGRR|nr:uncharacterized protein LOC106778988 [Vigna radiata var. radiata]
MKGGPSKTDPSNPSSFGSPVTAAAPEVVLLPPTGTIESLSLFQDVPVSEWRTLFIRFLYVGTGELYNWRLRVSMNSSTIIEMNSLLKESHVERIRMTLFHWKSEYVANMPCAVLDDLDSLCLYDWASCVHNHLVQSLNNSKNKIMSARMKKSLNLSGNVAVLQLHLDWYVSRTDRHNDELRIALGMDDIGLSKGEESKGEASRIEESDDESTDTATWLQDAVAILKKTNSEIASLHGHISRLTKELMDLREFPMQNEEATFGDPGEGVGGGDEDVGFGDDDHPLGDEEPAAGDEEAAGTHNEGGTSEHRPDYIDVVDEEDDVPKGLVPLVVAPLRSYAGYPSASDVDVDRLVVCEIMWAFLDTNFMRTLAPRKYVDNLVVLFGSTMLLQNQRKLTGVVKRLIFNSIYAGHILADFGRRRPEYRNEYSLSSYTSYMRSDIFGLADIPNADFWCYAVKISTLELYVIDSMGKGVRNRKRIDNFVGENMAKFFSMLYNKPDGSIGPLSVKQANIPSQPNLYDCGVITLKAMKMWDGEDRYNGKSIPDYTNEKLSQIRKNYVKYWILDNDNSRLFDALDEYGLL